MLNFTPFIINMLWPKKPKESSKVEHIKEQIEPPKKELKIPKFSAGDKVISFEELPRDKMFGENSWDISGIPVLATIDHVKVDTWGVTYGITNKKGYKWVGEGQIEPLSYIDTLDSLLPYSSINDHPIFRRVGLARHTPIPKNEYDIIRPRFQEGQDVWVIFGNSGIVRLKIKDPSYHESEKGCVFSYIWVGATYYMYRESVVFGSEGELKKYLTEVILEGK